MKFSVSKKILLNSIQRTTVRENYSENIIFEWLNLPCIKYCSPDGLLSQEDLFLLCFQFLDYIKQFDNFSDPKLQNKLRCIPYEANNLLDYDKYNGYAWQCDTEKLLLLMALHALTYIANIQPIIISDKPLSETARYRTPDPFEPLINDLGSIMSCEQSIWQPIASGISDSLISDSPFFQQSRRIIQQNAKTKANESHIAEYIKNYLKNPQRLSELIQNEVSNATNDDDNNLNDDNDATDYEQLQQLEQQIQQQKEQIEYLQADLKAYTQHSEGSVKICKGCKSKAAALFSAMFYAGYFQGEDGISGRDDIVGYILKYAFGDPRNNLRPLLSAYINYGGGANLDELKDELRKTIERQLGDALDDLKSIRKEANLT